MSHSKSWHLLLEAEDMGEASNGETSIILLDLGGKCT